MGAGSERFWDKAAERYAKSPIADVATYQKKLEETRRFLKPHMRVLEFGCGTGSTAIEHAPHVQQIDAIDISENMLAIGRDKAAAAGVNNLRFTRGTLAEFGAEAASFDAVLGLNVIHLVPDRQAVLAEVARILKPGGVFVSSTVCLGHSYLRFIKLLVPLGRRLGMMPDVYVFTESQLTAEIRAAGFDVERQWRHGKNVTSAFVVAQKSTAADPAQNPA